MRSRFRFLLELVCGICLIPVFYLPGRPGNYLRFKYYGRRLKHLGKNVVIDVGVYIQNPEYVSIDDHSWIDRSVMLLAGPPKAGRETRYKHNSNFVLNPGELHIGKNVHIGPFCVVSAIGGVFVGDDVGFAAGSKVYSFSHHYRSFKDPSNASIAFTPLVLPEHQSMLSGPIVVGSNVGMAVNCVILPGVTVGQNSFVLTGSVVAHDVPQNSLASGNPARVIGERFADMAQPENMRP